MAITNSIAFFVLTIEWFLLTRNSEIVVTICTAQKYNAIFRHSIMAPSKITTSWPIVRAAEVIEIKTPRIDTSLFAQCTNNNGY